MRLLLPVVSLLALASAAHADPCEAPLPPAGSTFSGPVSYVGDGDSLCVAGRRTETWVEVRLADFDAAELQAPGGPEAKAALSRIARGREVDCEAGRRSYDRVAGKPPVRDRSRRVRDLLVNGRLNSASVEEISKLEGGAVLIVPPCATWGRRT